jgi:hypothetical protein
MKSSFIKKMIYFTKPLVDGVEEFRSQIEEETGEQPYFNVAVRQLLLEALRARKIVE